MKKNRLPNKVRQQLIELFEDTTVNLADPIISRNIKVRNKNQYIIYIVDDGVYNISRCVEYLEQKIPCLDVIEAHRYETSIMGDREIWVFAEIKNIS